MMHFLRFFICVCLCTGVSNTDNSCVTPNGEEAKCVSIRHCPILKTALASGDPSAEEFVEVSACESGKSIMVCCGTAATYTKNSSKPESESTTELDEQAQKRFKKETVLKKYLPNRKVCGMQHWDDYFHLENETKINEASVDEFPWMVYQESRDGCTSCNGILISNGYMLANPKCLYCGPRGIAQFRIGVHKLSHYVSCIATRFGDDCTEQTQFVTAQKESNITEDIALVKFKERFSYSDFVRPICLPFVEMERPKAGDTVTISGWRNPTYGTRGLSVATKQKSDTQISKDCNSTANDGFLCAVLPDEFADIVTSIGPLMYKYHLNWFAIAISQPRFRDRLVLEASPLTTEVVDQILDTIALWEGV